MNFPLEIRFRLIALASQIAVRDAGGLLICHVRQKAFKLKEAVTVFSDEAQTRPLYTITADRIIDISAIYQIDDVSGHTFGSLHRHGMKSFWRAHYEVHRGGRHIFTISEENPWVRMADGIVSQIPLLNLLSGYVFHPAFLLRAADSQTVALRVLKRPALFEGIFQIAEVGPLDEDDRRLAVIAILMMLILERQRG